MGVNFDRPITGNDNATTTGRPNAVAAAAAATVGATAGAAAGVAASAGAVATDTVKLTGRPGDQSQVSFFAPTAPAKETSTASDIIGAATDGINVAYEAAKAIAASVVSSFRAEAK